MYVFTVSTFHYQFTSSDSSFIRHPVKWLVTPVFLHCISASKTHRRTSDHVSKQLPMEVLVALYRIVSIPRNLEALEAKSGNLRQGNCLPGHL